ncbi:MAG: hypothetical protein A2826_00070 [Candidatus Doudnabacteria bacterium RIFCSPHIGHO2_01_FULL_43_23]|uniref:Acetolactate synthase n=1 Tax=Candidatus Doudnabacteria bacterium RIFCSPHIGHO2_01_FULL_43_23 TaxID=1817822 RepID=A0A1F5NQX3_9BACT|nr:MAG: hypothetical protein A2826_00070 [Candidatus Doudnabacteria bacterium RIFCSPHIGHO2_01_FULL_43_23]
MKLTDYLANFISGLGVKHPFLIIGGASAHIVDSFGKHSNIDYISMQHEQSASMAADAYARITGKIGVASATSGPGATNLITGVCCSYFDSIPTLMISGQVNVWETKGKKKIRQAGFQETDIIDIVRPITKYSVMITDPEKIRYELEKCVYLATHGRPGPVWIDIPLNVQHAEIDPEKLKNYNPKEETDDNTEISQAIINQVLSVIKSAKRPVIIAGNGIKLSRSKDEFFKFVEKLGMPVVSTWSGIDIMPYEHKLYAGQFGVYGRRGANFTVQNSDLLISLGSRLDTRQTGGQPKTFAREAKKIVVEIDKSELFKDWVEADIPVHADVKDFLKTMNESLKNFDSPNYSEWLFRCKEWKFRYPAVLPEWYEQKDSVNSYVFIKSLSDRLKEGDIIVADQGGNLTWTIQAWEIKKDQELFSAFGNSPMGYALPAAIGAAFARPGQDIYCIDGDGGFQLNIQELQTVVHHNLPIKIFVLNNHSYGIIKQFQEIYFGGRYEGTIPEKGYSMPDFVKVAEAYGIPTVTIANHDELPDKLDKILAMKGPVLIDVLLSDTQKLIPKLVAVRSDDGQRYISKPIEDMVPLLSREEFYANMIVKPLEEGDKDKSSEIN